MQDADFRMCLYQHPNAGDHPVTSVVQDIAGYGYRTSGDRFLVHVADIKSRPMNFIVEEIKLPTLTPKRAPAPVRISDIGNDALDPVAARNMELEDIKAEGRLAAESLRGTLPPAEGVPIPVKAEKIGLAPMELGADPEPEPVVPEPEPEPEPAPAVKVPKLDLSDVPVLEETKPGDPPAVAKAPPVKKRRTTRKKTVKK